MSILDTLMRVNPVSVYGSNIVGIVAFILMNAISALHFYKRTNSPWHEKLFSVFGAVVSAHFFIHAVDMMSLPATIWRITLPTVLKESAYTVLPFWQWFGAEIVVVYSYRKYLNLRNLWLILPLMSIYAFVNQLYWGTTSIQSFALEARLPFYIFSYIPTWILFVIVYWKLFLRHE